MSICHYYRATPEDYEAARLAVDAALGYPSEDAETIWTPVDAAVRSDDGMCLLALWDELLAVHPVADAAETLTEIDEDTYRAAMPQGM